MNRREFLTGATLLSVQEPINKVFLPVIEGLTGTRFAVIADMQMIQGNIDEMFPVMAARPVEFFIVAGDLIGTNPIRVDGIDPFGQWPPTITNLEKLDKPWLAVAGNHDWGTAYARPNTFDDYRQDALDAWTQFVGPRQWTKELEYTRVIGLDYHDWTPENQAWIAEQLNTQKRTMVISHYPLTGCSTKWQDKFWDWLDWYEAQKLQFFQAHGLDIFVCGHRHQFGFVQVGNMTHIICPAVAPVVGDNQPEKAPDGIIPMTIPMRGWLEFVDSPVSLTIELWRNDNKLLTTWSI